MTKDLKSELAADVEEMSAIDGVHQETLNGGGLITSPSPMHATWISASTAKMTVKIPAGTRFELDADGKLVNIDDIVIEL